MLLSKARLIGPLPAIYIGKSIIEYKATASSERSHWKLCKQIEPPEEIQVSTQSSVRVILSKSHPAMHYVCVTRLGRGLSDGVI